MSRCPHFVAPINGVPQVLWVCTFTLAPYSRRSCATSVYACEVNSRACQLLLQSAMAASRDVARIASMEVSTKFGGGGAAAQNLARERPCVKPGGRHIAGAHLRVILSLGKTRKIWSAMFRKAMETYWMGVAPCSRFDLWILRC